jgi:UDP-2-acetamido-3-amino-2,3-dideoxy-glucuronate N-acetyltransferase
MDLAPPRIEPLTVVHPSAVLGGGSVVWQFANICLGVKTGTNCAIGSGVYVGRYTVMGDDVRVQDKAHLTDRMIIGDRVFIGPCAVFINDRHPVVNNPDYKPEPPIVEDDVSVGANATILPGVRLGRGCVVGAGAVVTKDVAPGTIVAGNPAKPLRTRTMPYAGAGVRSEG